MSLSLRSCVIGLRSMTIVQMYPFCLLCRVPISRFSCRVVSGSHLNVCLGCSSLGCSNLGWQIESSPESLVLPLHLRQHALPSFAWSLLCQLGEDVSY